MWHRAEINCGCGAHAAVPTKTKGDDDRTYCQQTLCSGKDMDH
jgi:hypothetical protein